MSVKTEKESINVVELDSSDEEEDGDRAAKRRKTSIAQPFNESGTAPVSSSSDQNQTLAWRSFWKAGAYDVGPKEQGSLQDLELARVHPEFLHSKATAHKWAFGAIAELLDSAVDEMMEGNGSWMYAARHEFGVLGKEGKHNNWSR